MAGPMNKINANLVNHIIRKLTLVFRTSGFIEQWSMARLQSMLINVYGLFRTSDISSR